MESMETVCDVMETNPSNPPDVEVFLHADEQMAEQGIAFEKLSIPSSIPLPSEANDEDEVESKEPVESDKILPNGESEMEKDDKNEPSPSDNEGSVQDEVANAINEQELKYWDAVKENPQDFTSWTYLLQFVEQENKLDSVRKAFDAFLKRYPFCYGYWKKFADMEKKNGDVALAREIFEKGIEAVALSVDLWVHYLNFTSHSTKTQPDNSSVMRCLFERAITAAGEEFRSDKLWDAYIEWEKAQRQLQRVTALYDRVLTVPTQSYIKHWEKFQEHINSNPPHEVLTAEELLKLKTDLGAAPPGFSFENETVVPAPPPGVENEAAEGDVTAGEEQEKATESDDPEATAVRGKVIALRKVVHDANKLEVNKRWVFEDAIKRPYFHVKPLERIQLKNWREYLDFEISTGNHRRVVILFERCLISCALYEDFWQRFASYMEAHDCVEGCQQVYERACDVHLLTKPHIHLAWATFEEKHGNVERARGILANLDSAVPGLAYVKLRRANLERRCKQIPNVCSIYESAISESTDTDLMSFYAIKYARFLVKIAKDSDKAGHILKTALEKDKKNKRLYLQLLDLELSVSDIDEEKVEKLFDIVKNSGLSEDVKEGFSQRRLEFLEDFSSNVVKIMKAQEAHGKLYKFQTSAWTGRKRSQDDGPESSAKMAKTNHTSDPTQSTGSYDSATDYTGGYPATTTYNYTTPQWPAYPAGQTAYNYSNWYQQQYGQSYQPTQ